MASPSPRLRQPRTAVRSARSVSPRRSTGRPASSSTWTRPLTTAGANDLKRAVLDAYGLVRLTAKADDYLERAFALTAPS